MRTTHGKPMASTLPWTMIHASVAKNPYKNATLAKYTPANQMAQVSIEDIDSNGWNKQSVVPATPLSAVLLQQDCIYNATIESSRRAMLRDETTDLQEKAVMLLKGRGWPVRKTAEGIAAIGLEEGRASTWPSIGWRALAALRECQLVLINEEKKTVEFFPEDIRTWSSQVEILFLEYECRYIWAPRQEGKVQINTWLSEKEREGWGIGWPIADGTIVELRAASEKLNESATGKRKEALQKSVGRAQAIHQFSSWSSL
jgi:hypothetical protein